MAADKPVMRSRIAALMLLSTSLLAAGCDQLGIESASTLAARREADGKAVGGACRHAGRAIEDCYVLNRKADRAAVYAGWREMNEYMRENKMEPVVPQLEGERQVAAKAPEAAETPAESKPRRDKADDKAGSEKAPDKAADKPAEATAPKHRRPPP